MINTCNHDFIERETACADGFCPICATAEITRLKGEAESWEQVFDKTCQLLAEAKEELAEAVAKERERCAKVCDEMEKSADGTDCCKWPTPSDCAYAIRKGE